MQRSIDVVGKFIQHLEKLRFDGSVDGIKCVTLHEEYIALSNRIVLKQVVPLLQDREGQVYRRRGNKTENE